MDPKSPETNQSKPEIIKLNQEFQPFNSKFDEGIILKTDFLPDIKFVTSLGTPNQSFKYQVLAPFNPDAGYIITEDDFEIEKRRDKFLKQVDDLTRSETEGELCLGAYPEDNSFFPDNSGIEMPGKENMERLRLQLFFPNNLSFEGKPDIYECIFFMGFYPLDTGELPKGRANAGGHFLPDAFYLVLPDNINLLQQIRAKFVLVPETMSGK